MAGFDRSSEQIESAMASDDLQVEEDDEPIDRRSADTEVQEMLHTHDSQATYDEPQEKLIKLPLSRIRNIIKTDPDIRVVSQDAVVTLAKAAELFIQSLAKEAAGRTLRDKRKTILRKHLDTVFENKDCFSFLEGILESYEA